MANSVTDRDGMVRMEYRDRPETWPEPWSGPWDRSLDERPESGGHVELGLSRCRVCARWVPSLICFFARVDSAVPPPAYPLRGHVYCATCERERTGDLPVGTREIELYLRDCRFTAEMNVKIGPTGAAAERERLLADSDEWPEHELRAALAELEELERDERERVAEDHARLAGFFAAIPV